MPRLADRLAQARSRAFVGRDAELTHVTALFDPPGQGAVVFVHGPGGIGKTSLLRELARRGERAGRTVHWIDGRDPDALAPAAPGTPSPLDQPGLLVAVDTAEHLTGLRDWLLANLRDDTIALVAGRDGPDPAWLADPGWRELLHPVRLGPLGEGDSRALLAGRGVPEQGLATALECAHGHPLALALAADVCAQRGEAVALTEDPQVVTALLGVLLGTVPSPRHRAALEAAALVSELTEPLLAALLDGDAREEFGWLRGLSIIEYGRRGLFPHDLAREALAAEIRWRHPDRYRDLHHRAGAYYQRQFTGAGPAAQQAVLADFTYLHRHSPVLAPFLAVLRPGQDGAGLRQAHDGDWPALRAMVAEHEGEESAELAAYWFRERPSATLVAGDGDGFATVLDLSSVDSAARAADPAVAAACGYLERRAPLRDGERATLIRFWLDRSAYQQFSATQAAITLHLVRHYLTAPNLAFTFLPYADPDAWAAACEYTDLARLPEADFTVGGHRYGVYGHDWRATPPVAWLALLAEREIAGSPSGHPPAADPPPGLDEAEFAAAVREALREFTRPARLAASPLLRTGLADSVAGLQQAIRDAVSSLDASPRDRRLHRVLHHTYLQPAPTQQAAADLLGLPLTTYRRHLAAGAERIAEILRTAERPGPP